MLDSLVLLLFALSNPFRLWRSMCYNASTHSGVLGTSTRSNILFVVSFASSRFEWGKTLGVYGCFYNIRVCWPSKLLRWRKTISYRLLYYLPGANNLFQLNLKHNHWWSGVCQRVLLIRSEYKIKKKIKKMANSNAL